MARNVRYSIYIIILWEVKSESYLAAGMCNRFALVIIVFVARDLRVISNSRPGVQT